MNRYWIALLLVAIARIAIGQDTTNAKPPLAKPSIAEDLNNAVRKFDQELLTASEQVIEGIEELIENTKNNQKLPVTKKIEALDLLDGAKDSFLGDGTLPSNIQLRGIKSSHERSVRDARRVCIKAFEDAIRAYGELGEIDAARETKKELDEFMKSIQGASNDGETTRNRSIASNRKNLDSLLEFVGKVKPIAATWPSDQLLIAANGGSRLESVVHGNFIAAKSFCGQPLVLFCHPVSKTEPGYVDFRKAISGMKGSLIIRMRNWPTGDANARVIVNDKPWYETRLAGDVWKQTIVPLDGSKNDVRLQVTATGWFFEYCMFTYDIAP